MKATLTANHLLQTPDEVFYLESSLPPGLTIGEYRRSRPGAGRRRSARLSLRRSLALNVARR